MSWTNNRTDKSTAAATTFRRAFTRDPILIQNEKRSLETHQTTAEDDLLSITNDIFPSTPNPEMEIHQISAWNQHAKYSPFRVRSPLKQVGKSPSLKPKQSLPSQLGDRNEMRNQLKAKLRHYEVNRSVSFGLEAAEQANGKTSCDDYWNEVEILNLDKMSTNAVSKQPRIPKKTMLLQPFFTIAIKRNFNSQKRAKSTNSQQCRRGSVSSRNSSSPRNSKLGTIAHTTELKFPLISEETKLHARLSFYRKETSISK